MKGRLYIRRYYETNENTFVVDYSIVYSDGSNIESSLTFYRDAGGLFPNGNVVVEEIMNRHSGVSLYI